MRCPYCGHTKNRVVDSRTSREGRAIRRRRQCDKCGERFTTYESLEERPLSVRKRDRTAEPFDRAKLVRGIQVACARRRVDRDQIDGIADAIQETLERSESGEVDSAQIGELVMERLRAIDQVAYVRFASVYRDFQDTQAYLDEVRRLATRAGYDAAQLDFLESALADERSAKDRARREGGR